MVDHIEAHKVVFNHTSFKFFKGGNYSDCIHNLITISSRIEKNNQPTTCTVVG